METESKMEWEKKPALARNEAADLPGSDPADANVDACIPERLRPDGTASWFPRAAGLGLGVPQQPDKLEDAPGAELAALTGQGAREEKGKIVVRRLLGKGSMPVGRTPGREPAAVKGRTAGTGSALGAEDASAVHPVREPEVVRPEDGTAVFFRPASRHGAAKESAERTIPAMESMEGPLAVATPAGERPAWPHAERSETPLVPPAATAVALREQATFFSASLPVQEAHESGATRNADHVRGVPMPADRAWATPTEKRENSGTGHPAGVRRVTLTGHRGEAFSVDRAKARDTAGDTLADARGTDAPRRAWFHQEYRAEAEAQSAVDETWRAGRTGAVQRNLGFDATTRGAGTHGSRSGGARAGDATAHASPGEKAARAAWIARLAGVPAVDIKMFALREEKTLQLMDVSSSWKGGLPDMSGVVLADTPRYETTSTGRVRAAVSPPAVMPVPESVPAVQVNATLRVDEEELVCAVERVITRQAQRG